MGKYPVFLYISIFSLIAPILLGAFRIKILERSLKILILYLIIVLSANILSVWFLVPKVNLILHHIIIPMEFAFIMLIIISWQKSQKMANFMKIVSLVYLLIWIFAKLSFEPTEGIYSVTTSISQTIISLAAGYTLFLVIGDSADTLLSNHRFWILLSFVVFYFGTLMPPALTGILFKEPSEDLYLLWHINWILIIISNILYTVGILCPQTRQ